MEKIKKICRFISTFGRFGLMPFGVIAGSFIAVVAMYVAQGLVSLQQASVFGIVATTIVVCGLVMQIALLGDGYFDRNAFVLDKISGLMFAFLFVPAQIKVMIFGFILFHIIIFIFRFIQFRWSELQFSDMPGVLAYIVDDIAAGFFVNLFLHLMIWIVH